MKQNVNIPKENLVKYKFFFKMVLTNGILCVILFSEADWFDYLFRIIFGSGIEKFR